LVSQRFAGYNDNEAGPSNTHISDTQYGQSLLISNKCSFKSLVPNLAIVDILFIEYKIFKPMEHLEG